MENLLSKVYRPLFGRTEVPVTVFVPWDCCNDCKFCTTKHEYRDLYPPEQLEQNMEAVAKSIAMATKSEMVTDVVFTGGEPLADIARLEKLCQAIQGEKRVFANTSLTFTRGKDF